MSSNFFVIQWKFTEEIVKLNPFRSAERFVFVCLNIYLFGFNATLSIKVKKTKENIFLNTTSVLEAGSLS